MKRFCLFLLALCLFGMAEAQVGIMRSSGISSVQKTNLQDLGPLTKKGNIYYYHGKPMKQAEMVQFLNENCAEAYNYYRKQHKIEMAGWGMFCAGIVVTMGIGVPMCVVGGAKSDYYEDLRGKTTDPGLREQYYQEWGKYGRIWDAGLGFCCGIGPGITALVGVPMIIVGNVQKKNAHRVYNSWCGSEEMEGNSAEISQFELKLISGANGLGLALAF